MRLTSKLNTIAKKMYVANSFKTIANDNPLLIKFTTHLSDHIGNLKLENSSNLVIEDVMVSCVRTFEKYKMKSDALNENFPTLNYMAALVHEASLIAGYDITNNQKKWDFLGNKNFNQFCGNSTNQIVIKKKYNELDMMVIRKQLYKKITQCDDEAWFTLVNCAFAQNTWSK